MGRRNNWRVYQSVLSNERQGIIPALQRPCTSWAYQSGKVSLSPEVIRIPYGSTELRRSAAKSAVSVCPAREADCQLAKRGTKAAARTGVASSQLLRRGRSRVSFPTRAFSDPIRAAIVSHA